LPATAVFFLVIAHVVHVVHCVHINLLLLLLLLLRIIVVLVLVLVLEQPLPSLLGSLFPLLRENSLLSLGRVVVVVVPGEIERDQRG
jgi:hypothetical protein